MNFKILSLRNNGKDSEHMLTKARHVTNIKQKENTGMRVRKPYKEPLCSSSFTIWKFGPSIARSFYPKKKSGNLNFYVKFPDFYKKKRHFCRSNSAHGFTSGTEHRFKTFFKKDFLTLQTWRRFPGREKTGVKEQLNR